MDKKIILVGMALVLLVSLNFVLAMLPQLGGQEPPKESIDACIGKSAEDVYITTVGVSVSALESLTFYKKYTKRYGSEPDLWTAISYEAANVVLLAIERAGTKDRAKILEEVSKIKNYNGLLGKWGFDENGDTTLCIISANRVIGGELVFEKLLEEDC